MYFTSINYPTTLLLWFYKSNHKCPRYNLVIKEAAISYTTIGTIDFKQPQYD